MIERLLEMLSLLIIVFLFCIDVIRAKKVPQDSVIFSSAYCFEQERRHDESSFELYDLATRALVP